MPGSRLSCDRTSPIFLGISISPYSLLFLLLIRFRVYSELVCRKDLWNAFGLTTRLLRDLGFIRTSEYNVSYTECLWSTVCSVLSVSPISPLLAGKHILLALVRDVGQAEKHSASPVVWNAFGVTRRLLPAFFRIKLFVLLFLF